MLLLAARMRISVAPGDANAGVLGTKGGTGRQNLGSGCTQTGCTQRAARAGAVAARAAGPLGPSAQGCHHRASLPQGLFIALKTSTALSAERGALWQARLWWVPGPLLPPGCQPGLKGSVPNSRRGSSGPRAASGGAVARAALINNYVPPPPLASRSVSAVNANRGFVGMAHSISRAWAHPHAGGVSGNAGNGGSLVHVTRSVGSSARDRRIGSGSARGAHKTQPSPAAARARGRAR